MNLPSPRQKKAGRSLCFGLALLASACQSEIYKEVYESTVSFRAAGDYFEIRPSTSAGWQTFFAKGVNLAISTPGHFPGELHAEREEYDRWLQWIAEMNCNMIRLYTLHYPVFYEAFGAYNRAHPERPLYLVQGIWLDELEEGDYMSDASEQLAEEIANVIDAVHGEANIGERLGKAHGLYRHDVSDYVMAWLPGHEMDGERVKVSQKIWAPYSSYDGYYISSPEGLPIEAWVARGLDHVVAYELSKYGDQRPVGWSNWPALDPIHHPTETSRYGQDVVDVDFGRFTTKAPYTAGLFVSYHIYPFNPEFIIYDPGYKATIDQQGKPNSYLGYLLDLKAHHRGIPLFVTEYGLPSSQGIAHVNELAYNHGGYNEQEQASHVVDLYQAIVESGAAGAVLFEWIDEWFKRNWLTNPTTIPADRAPLWYDVLNPEEGFGALAYYPLEQSIVIDGEITDWVTPDARLVEQPGLALAPIGDGGDSRRTITALYTAADPAYLSLRIDTAASGDVPNLAGMVWYIGISTIGGDTGDRRLPDTGVRLPSGQGLEAVVILDQDKGVAELRIDEEYDPSMRLNGRSKSGGQPVGNDNGSFVLSSLIINNDEAYASMGKPFVPEVKWFAPGLLRRGNSRVDTLAHYELGHGVIELRLPWHALWITDPSSHSVLDDDPSSEGLDASETAGFSIVVLAVARTKEGLQVIDALPRAGFAQGSFDGKNIPLFTWEGWDVAPVVQERLKPLYHALTQAHGETP